MLRVPHIFSIASYFDIDSLPNDRILDVTKLKAFADNELNVAKMTISFWLAVFSSFPTVFSKAFFFRVFKSRDCVVKSLTTNPNLIGYQ